MIITFPAGAWRDSQNHTPQHARYIFDDKIVVLEAKEDEQHPELPDEIAQMIAARHALPATNFPESVDMCQARLALLGVPVGETNALVAADAAIAALTGAEGDAARVMWEYSPTVRRDDPLVSAMGAALGLSSQQIDALFIAAADL